MDMTTAAVLHYNGDIPSVVRFMGGPHVNAHIDVPNLISNLRTIVDPQTLSDLNRILTFGSPAKLNATNTEKNFQAYLAYGNHKSASDNPALMRKLIVKNSRRGFIIIMDPELIHLIPNAHVTPQGIVDTDHVYRNPRPIHDSTFRPEPWCMAINDWIDKSAEPAVTFAPAYLRHLKFLYNLRITYPDKEILPADDDGTAAYPRIKHNPNAVASQSYLADGVLAMSTGQNFGAAYSPANYDPFARARQQLAQHLWSTPDLLERAAEWMPELKIAPPPTATEIASFVPASADRFNTGVLHPDGSRIPPQFNHHVDDNLYADIPELIDRALAASIMAIYTILGFPDGRFPDPLSREKLVPIYQHIRDYLGGRTDTRRLTIGCQPAKRVRSTSELLLWLDKANLLAPCRRTCWLLGQP